MEVVQQLSATRVRCVLLGASELLSRGMEVESSGAGIRVPVGEATLGRMFNVLGEPIDGEGALPENTPQWEIHRKPPVFSEQRPATELLETGIKVIALLNQREAFSFRKAVPFISQRLGVSRYTVYKYLSEIAEQKEELHESMEARD